MHGRLAPAGALAAVAPGAPPSAAPPPEPLATPRPGRLGLQARLSWRFRSASPVTGAPGVSSSGRVYVTSVEGYVHALGPDGGFRWSYGVGGVPLGSPAVDADGQVYVATSEGRLLALRPDGRLAWALTARGRLAAAPIWADGVLYFTGRDRGLYGVAATGGPPSRRDLGEPASASLASLGGGLLALGTSAGGALLYRRTERVAKLELGGDLSQPLLGAGERCFAVTAGGITAFDPATGAVLWSAPARRAALSPDRRSLVIEAEHELRWLSPQTGEVLGRARLPGDASAPPALTDAGAALVPLVSGELWVVDLLVAGAATVAVGPAPLWAPVNDPARGRVLVTAGGWVAAVELEGGAGPSGAGGAAPGGPLGDAGPGGGQ